MLALYLMRITERYVRASRSSNLRAHDAVGAEDVDALIAAGWTRDGLAPIMLRLRAEFDGRGVMHNLSAARSAVRRFTTQMARHSSLSIAAVRRIERAVLVWWLNPPCPACSGTRYLTVPGTVRLSDHVCSACDGSGRRSAVPLPNKVERELFKSVSAALEHKTERTLRMMSRFMRVG